MKVAYVILFFTLSLLLFVGVGRAATVEQITLPAAFAPERGAGIVLSNDGRTAFVTSFNSDLLFAFDAATGALLGQAAVGDGPGQLAIFEQGARRIIAVASTAFIGTPEATVTFIDAADPARLTPLSTANLGRKFTLRNNDRTLTFNSDGSAAFVVAQSNKPTVFSLNVATGAIAGRYLLDSAPVATALATIGSRDQLLLLMGGAEPLLLFVDVSNPRDPRLITDLPLPGESTRENNIVVRDDFAFFAAAGSNQLLVVDVGQRALAASAATGNFPGALTVVDNGERKLVAVTAIFDGSVNLLEARARGNQLTLTTAGRFKASAPFLTTAPFVSADGQRGFVATEFGQRLFVFDTATGQQLGTAALDGLPDALALARDPAGERLAIVDPFNQRVALFATQQSDPAPRALGSFTTPTGANFLFTQNILLSADGQRAFVASPTTNELLIIDVEQRAIAARVGVGLRPERIALYESAGVTRVAVVNTNALTISLVEAPPAAAASPLPARVTGTVKLAANPITLNLAVIVFSNDGRIGYVADGIDKLIAFDAVSGEIVDSLEVDRQPVGLAIWEQQNQRRLALICSPDDRNHSVLIIDATGPLQQLARYGAPKEQKFALNNIPVFSTDGRFVYVTASFSLELISLDAATGTLISKVKGMNAIQPTLFNSNGRDRLVAVTIGAGKVFIIEVDNQGRLRKVANLKPPKGTFFTVGNNAAVLPGAERIIVSEYGGRLLSFDIANNRVAEMTLLDGGPSSLALSRDGRRLVILGSNASANRITLVSL